MVCKNKCLPWSKIFVSFKNSTIHFFLFDPFFMVFTLLFYSIEHACSLAPPFYWGGVLQALRYAGVFLLLFFFGFFLTAAWNGKGGGKILQSRRSCGSSSNVHHFHPWFEGWWLFEGPLNLKPSSALSSLCFHLTQNLKVWILGQFCEEHWVPLATRHGACVSAVARDNDWQFIYDSQRKPS